MSRGRKPEERSIVAGIRFKRAIKIFGKSIKTLIDDLRWQKNVNIFDEKTIRTRNGFIYFEKNRDKGDAVLAHEFVEFLLKKALVKVQSKKNQVV